MQPDPETSRGGECESRGEDHRHLDLLRRADVVVSRRHGIVLTVPVVTAAIRRKPVSLGWLQRALTATLPIPGWCFLNLVWLRKHA